MSTKSRLRRMFGESRTCHPDAIKACWQADVSTAVDVVLRLSDNERYDSKEFVREVIRKLETWTKP